MSNIKKYEPLWGAWYVDELIGEGSFGKVYRVHREEFGKVYYSAVKIISIPQNEADLRYMKSEGLDEASVRSFFHAYVTDIVQEICLMSEFRGNSNVVSFEDHKVIEKLDGIGWDILIRMELLESLTNITAEQPLSQDEVIKLGIHISKALELCALKKIIHRDIKPDNIFISQYGDYKLGDFGIARQIENTMSGMSKKGTFTFMAPEIFKGCEYGASVDIYSLGIVMYRLLNKNRMPFLPEFPSPIIPNDRDRALLRRMNGEPLPDIKGILMELNAIVLKACAYDLNMRYTSPTEFREALEAAAHIHNYTHVDADEDTEIIDITPVKEDTISLFTQIEEKSRKKTVSVKVQPDYADADVSMEEPLTEASVYEEQMEEPRENIIRKFIVIKRYFWKMIFAAVAVITVIYIIFAIIS